MSKSLWIAIPCYTGTVTCETAIALNTEVYHAYKRGWAYEVHFYQQNPIISYARNFLVREFLESDSTDMIFVDSDVGFAGGTLCRLADYPVDICGAAYPYRNDSGEFPIRYIEERTELWADPDTGLLEVAGLPAGCLKISRSCLEAMCAKHPELLYKDLAGKDTFSLFEFTRDSGQFFGEDWAFCNLARADGFKIWLDPQLDMTHTGTKVFKGNLGKKLQNRDPMDEILAFVERNKAAA